MKRTPFLKGKHLILTQFLDSDLNGPYSNWLNDPEVCQGNAHCYFPTSSLELKKFIDHVQQSKDILFLAIVESDTQIHIGNICLKNINHFHQRAEIAILIGEKSAWGKGYGLESCRLLVEHGFKELNLHSIYCGTLSNNIGMQKIALKLGMRKEGIRKESIYKSGKYLDIIDYGILKSEWKPQ